ncbi:nuclear transport factor 2 family protein [Streptomyces sp. TRM 70361]|uniref:nuclear transport factor 2 family protein n=1 Tax=Streptomyces sp. TRM 70361 TaxID=3116553 RepID=UPI002E7B24D5|nr:nuclear transport factor 2 family protein [Streptomyces sp. TRM 70361]MEE1938652.1 nuclear transport factor 2 family protein [Streptomyces sp. TRM 70361]
MDTPPSGPAPLERLLAERACERVVVDFVHRLDLGEPGSVAELFAPDGVWEWPAGGRRVQGREALRAYFGSRPAGRLSRRMCANLLVTAGSATRATAVTYFATYRVDGHTGGLVPARPPVNIGHYEDVLHGEGGEWRIAHRTLRLAFGGETERLGRT